MKWQIGGGGWPVNGGATLIPAGTIVEGDPSWNGMTLPMPMPINAVPLDADAAQLMLGWYEPEHWHRLRFGPGTDVEAIKMKVAALTSTARHPRRYVPSRS